MSNKKGENSSVNISSVSNSGALESPCNSPPIIAPTPTNAVVAGDVNQNVNSISNTGPGTSNANSVTSTSSTGSGSNSNVNTISNSNDGLNPNVVVSTVTNGNAKVVEIKPSFPYDTFLYKIPEINAIDNGKII